MTRPYFFDAKRKGYVTSGTTLTRPNRNAAGMSYTAARGSHPHNSRVSSDLAQLQVRGTLDSLARWSPKTEHAVCGCCGARTGKLRLNRQGKLRLATLRSRRERSCNSALTGNS